MPKKRKSAKRRIWSVEIFDRGHWIVEKGGLGKVAAKKQARVYAKKGERVSIAEYTDSEGSSAISRETVDKKVK